MDIRLLVYILSLKRSLQHESPEPFPHISQKRSLAPFFLISAGFFEAKGILTNRFLTQHIQLEIRMSGGMLVLHSEGLEKDPTRFRTLEFGNRQSDFY